MAFDNHPQGFAGAAQAAIPKSLYAAPLGGDAQVAKQAPRPTLQDAFECLDSAVNDLRQVVDTTESRLGQAGLLNVPGNIAVGGVDPAAKQPESMNAPTVDYVMRKMREIRGSIEQLYNVLDRASF